MTPSEPDAKIEAEAAAAAAAAFTGLDWTRSPVSDSDTEHMKERRGGSMKKLNKAWNCLVALFVLSRAGHLPV
jgi:hypothetical protein